MVPADEGISTIFTKTCFSDFLKLNFYNLSIPCNGPQNYRQNVKIVIFVIGQTRVVFPEFKDQAYTSNLVYEKKINLHES